MVTPSPLFDDTKSSTNDCSASHKQLSDPRSSDDTNADRNTVSSPLQSHLNTPEILRPGPVNLTSTPSLVPVSQEGEESNGAVQTTSVNPAHGQSSGPQSSPGPAEFSASINLGRTETNPFKRKDLPLRTFPNTSPGTPSLAPAPSTAAFSGVDTIPGSRNNPWQPVSRDKDARPPSPPPFPTDLGPAPNQGPWQPDQARQQQGGAPGAALPALSSLSPEHSSLAWGDDNTLQPDKAPASPRGNSSDPTGRAGNTQDDDLRPDLEKGKQTASGLASVSKVAETADSGQEASPRGSAPEKSPEQESQEAEEWGPLLAPTLPPRPETDQQPSRHSPRPVDGQSETYQIKNITWYDHTAKENPRTTPILVQNANGPCPLLALVNALTLTTPAELSDTALVQVLRSREQISLGLLLDAVFDELMSPRRTKADASLPDVGDLYEFLKGLHTGMNVNPRFVPSSEMVQAFERTAMTQLDPSERGDLIPGTFEDTVEMNYYAAFSIPLIHGWLPTKSDPAHMAFERQAASYEDAQNLLFREEELEQKLSQPSGDGLTEEEQQLYQDIISMKSFFESSATQLTPWGLEVITKAMKPGMVAILFRNDHFSTLYRHPHNHRLLALVTDAGYSSHAEIVWESLADVNGLNTEFFSGDFRVVGGAGQSDAADHSTAWYEEQQPSSSTKDQDGWTTVGPRGKAVHPSSSEPGPSDATQEDRDLALALQLQEEEDERHRAEEARRRRERLLSEQYIEQQAMRTPTVRRDNGNHGRRPGGRSDSNASLVNPRTSSSTVATQPVTAMAMPTGQRQGTHAPAQHVRPLVPPVISQRGQPAPRPREDDDDAPPSYEQAQSASPYVPPVGHPSHPSSRPGAAQSPNIGAGNNPPSSPSAMPFRPVARPGHRRPVPTDNTVHAKERDCILM